ncbi:MAG TPA: formyltransferase family protein [Geomonas sp.]|nr:formyltransferase family protein [Geomonas sp.]
MKSVVVIGNGGMAVDCLKIMQRQGLARVPLVIADPGDLSLMFLRQHCQAQGLELQLARDVNSPETVAMIRALAPQLILNINSFQIIREELIALAAEGIVNFHNGPLPRYRGINVCSWAIMNGEKRYGVTWHFMEKGVDCGDIVAQKFFEVSETETAFSLIVKCIREGVALFEEFFPAFCQGRIARTSQNHAVASRYTRKDLPNGGFVDYGWHFQTFDRFVRGLNHSPLPNRFAHPKSLVDSKVFFVHKIARYQEAVPGLLQPGTIFGLDRGGIDVKIKDGAIRITDVLNDDAKAVRLERFIENYNLRLGGQLKPSGGGALGMEGVPLRQR